MNVYLRAVIVGIVIAGLIFTALWRMREAWKTPGQVSESLSGDYPALFGSDPDQLTFHDPLGLDAVSRYQERWTTYSPEGLRERQESLRRLAAQAAIPGPRAATASRAWYAALQQLAAQSEAEAAAGLPAPFGGPDGEPLRSWNLMGWIQPVRNVSEATAFIYRIEGLPKKLEDLLRLLEAQQQEGRLPPAWALAQARVQSRAILNIPPERSLPYRMFLRRAMQTAQLYPNILNDGKVAEFAELARRSLEKKAYPALDRFEQRLAAFEQQAPAEGGLARRPGGAGAYAQCLKAYCGTDASPDSLYRTARMAVAEAKKSYETALAEAAAEGATPASANTWQDAAACQRQAYLLLTDAYEKIEGILPDRPERLALSIELADSLMAPLLRTALYYPANLNGDRKAVWWVSPEPAALPAPWQLRAWVYAAAVPGEHLQIRMNQARAELPLVLRNTRFAAVEGGWRLYALDAAAEIGLFNDPTAPGGYDPLAKAGYRQYQLLAAAAMAADLGIHHLNWSREQARRYLAETAGIAEEQALALAEALTLQPGAGVAPWMGYLALRRLRQDCQTALGAGFAVQDFHRLVLGAGGAPMSFISVRVSEWLRKQAR